MSTPPYTLTPHILNLVAQIAEGVGRLSLTPRSLALRRADRIRTLRGSLAIEGNTLRLLVLDQQSLQQILNA